MAQLIIDSYQNAVASLKEALAQPKTAFLRDSVIQRFEYTFEMAVKLMKRVLEQMPESGVDALSFNDLCRAAAEAGLVAHPEAWVEYREARNKTSHAYDENIAEAVYAVAQRFLSEAEAFLRVLEKRV
ncbi:MAG: hypothetical protein RL141_289 [Candidatus Parcubacteria bacterium]